MDRRASRRFSASLQVLFMWQGRMQEGTASDVSMGGMRMSCEVDLDLLCQVSVEVSRPMGGAMPPLQGRVTWSSPSMEIAGLYEHGLEFVDLSGSARSELAGLVRELGGAAGSDDLPVAAQTDILSLEGAGGASAAPPGPARVVTPADDVVAMSRQLQLAVAADSERRSVALGRVQELAATARDARREGDLATAIARLREAVALAPDLPELHEELAAILYLFGEPREAARLFDKALGLRRERGE